MGAANLPTDGQIDPSGVTYALAKGARDRGATIYTETRVTGIQLKNGAVDEVITDKGNIQGGRSSSMQQGSGPRRSGRWWASPFPSFPWSTSISSPNPSKGSAAECLPCGTLTILSISARRSEDSSWEGYEHNPIPWALDGIPRDFTKKLLKSNYEHFEPLSLLAMKRVPVIGKAEIITLLNGPEAFTSDGDFIMGEAAEVKNFFVAAGFCAHGIAAAGGWAR